MGRLELKLDPEYISGHMLERQMVLGILEEGMKYQELRLSCS